VLHRVSGTVVALEKEAIALEVGGVSCWFLTAAPAAFSVGSSATVYAHLHWNQEQGPSLYGFTDSGEKQIFLLVISCSGLGPKIGLAVIASLGAAGFVHAVHKEDSKRLSSVPGIGLKKAEQIIVQLKHKVAKLIQSGELGGGDVSLEQWNNVAEVLASLHYKTPEVSRVMHYLNEQYAGENLPFDKLMRHALSFLAKKT
jgi:Holliday junction DNA helicase RuvA